VHREHACGGAGLRSGEGDLGTERGRDPGGDGASSPGEAIDLPGQRPCPAPALSLRHAPRRFLPGAFNSPYSWRAFVATHIPQATASSSVSCSMSHTPDQGPSLFRMTGSL
jgi:hypothetical protein